jgi:hypothetical protein
MSLVGRTVLAATLRIFPPCVCRVSVTAFAEYLLLRLQSIWYFLREATKNDATFTQESLFSISYNYITYNYIPYNASPLQTI